MNRLATSFILLLFLIGSAGAEPLRIVMLGPPGAGKGTHGKYISKLRGVPHISTGAMLRDNIKRNTSLGQEAQRFVKAGELVPDRVMVGMVRDRLSKEQSFILDGFPRTVAQGEALKQILKDQGKPLTHVIFLDVRDDEIVKRLTSRGREDDKPDIIRQRLKVYKESTKPLIRFYDNQGLLVRIDANGSIEANQKKVRGALEAPAHSGWFE